MTRLAMKIKAFSLIEMVVAIVILGIIASVGALLLQKSFQAIYTSRHSIERIEQVQHALRLVSSDLAEIRSNYAADLTITTSTISFKNVDGTTITYAKDGGNYLTRNGINLADNITTLTFSYYNASNALIANPGSADTTTVRCIKVMVASTKQNSYFNLDTLVCPRSFR